MKKRKQLGNMNGERRTFRGTFVRYGTKPAYNSSEPLVTLLLSNITDVQSSRVVTDHLWFNQTKGFEAVRPLIPGDVIQFDARVKQYVKGYVNRREWMDNRTRDYKLSHPTKISKVEK